MISKERTSAPSSTESGRDAFPVSVDPELCIGCGSCLNSCPTDVFRLDARTLKAAATYARDCHVCFLCEADCPTHAIRVEHDFSSPRRHSIYDALGINV